MENTELMRVIRTLEVESRKTGKKMWKTLAEELDKPKRRRVAVNLSRINRYTEEGEVVAVPGKVLGAGMLNHSVTIAAFQFSEMALRKIGLAEGNALTLTELAKTEIPVSKIKIMK